jgi:phosphoribosylaminoimidazolecarboxamide formyltransferase/IMP cyclohydrolase
MIRAAAKNFKYVTVIVNPSNYGKVADMILKNGEVSADFRMQLAQEAFRHTAQYDECIQKYLAGQLNK